MTYPPAFGSARLGQHLGPRGSAKRWVVATIVVNVFSFTAAWLGVAVAGGSWAARVGFGIAFVVLQTLFMIAMGVWLRGDIQRSAVASSDGATLLKGHSKRWRRSVLN